MLRHVSVFVLATLVAASGCTMSAGARRGTMLVGAGLTVASIFTIRSGATDNDNNGYNDTILDDDWGAYVIGSAMFVAGLLTLAGGLAAREEVEPDAAPPPFVVPAVATVPSPSTFAPMPAAPGATTVPVPDVVEVERIPVVALPELPATGDVLRLAKQVRSASTHGRCDAAWIMWTDLQKLDGDYARALRDGPVMSRCAM